MESAIIHVTCLLVTAQNASENQVLFNTKDVLQGD